MRLVLWLVLCLLAAGCTRAVEGAPAAASAPAPPPRPRELRLEGVDPCSLLTPAQRAALGLDGAPRFTKPYTALFQGDVPTCTITGYTGQPIALGIGTVTTTGIERWQTGDLAARVTATTIDDFPALVATPTRFTNYCSVEVDVAAGQLLDVQVSDGGGTPPIPQDQLCERARNAAAELIRSLAAH